MSQRPATIVTVTLTVLLALFVSGPAGASSPDRDRQQIISVVKGAGDPRQVCEIRTSRALGEMLAEVRRDRGERSPVPRSYKKLRAECRKIMAFAIMAGARPVKVVGVRILRQSRSRATVRAASAQTREVGIFKLKKVGRRWLIDSERKLS